MKSFLLVSAAATLALGQTPETAACEPVNPHATPEARALLKTICAASGKYIFSGQHNFPSHGARHSERTAELTGKYPAIWGSDFGFTGGEDKDSILGRDNIVEEAKRQYAAGAIVTLMWHVVRPFDDEPVPAGKGWHGSVQNKVDDFAWEELIRPETKLHKLWMAQIDTVAEYLKRLQEAKIPVIWRPYHEANGDWFWWGGRSGELGFEALYRMTFDRMVNVHHLDNLIWVWNSNAPNGKNAGPYADFYPGPQYCDVLATDVYGPFEQSDYDGLLSLANGKPIALGEVGRVPSLDVLKQQPRWAWFMVWAGYNDSSNDPAALKALFNDNHTLNRGDPPPAN